MCRSRFVNGAVAAGVARRAMATGFQGDLPALYVRLKGTDCPATPAMSQRLMRDLATAADARGGSSEAASPYLPTIGPQFRVDSIARTTG